MTQQLDKSSRPVVTESLLPPTDPSLADAERANRHPVRFALGKIFPFIGWVLSGFGLFPLLWRQFFGDKNARHNYEEVVVYSVHRSFFLWLIILAGFVCGPIARGAQSHGLQTFLGWFYVVVVIYTFVTLLFDVSTMKLLLWSGIFFLLWITAKYLQDMQHMGILRGLAGYLASLRPRIDPGFAVVVSWLLLPAWIGALFNTFLNGRKRFTPNEIGEFHIGDGYELTDRTGLRFRARYRDVFESMLGLGAGDILAQDNQQHVVKSYENILFLAFIWKRMDVILHQRSAVVDNAPEDPVEVEAVQRAPSQELHPQ
jgi:hypothetical protein